MFMINKMLRVLACILMLILAGCSAICGKEIYQPEATESFFNASGLQVDNENWPNKFGFYHAQYPITNLIERITGSFNFSDEDIYSNIRITHSERLSSCDFSQFIINKTDLSPTYLNGFVRIEYRIDSSGNQSYFYNFYLSDECLLASIPVSDDDYFKDITDLCFRQNSSQKHYVRTIKKETPEDQEPISSLVGEWKSDDGALLTITESRMED